MLKTNAIEMKILAAAVLVCDSEAEIKHLCDKLEAARRYGVSAQDAAFEWSDDYRERVMADAPGCSGDEAPDRQIRFLGKVDRYFRELDEALRVACRRHSA